MYISLKIGYLIISHTYMHAQEVRAVSEAQRAAWQVERNENEQPYVFIDCREPAITEIRFRDNLALRYVRRCAACLCENPRVRAVLTTCGHSSLCLPCAQEATGGNGIAICRTISHTHN